MSYVDSLGLMYEAVNGISTPRVTYAARAELNETHEAVGLGRFNEDAPGKVGWLAGILGAIGDADNKIGGYRVSRLMDPVGVGEDVFPVEDVQDWLDAGRVAIDGVVYTYTAKGPGRLSGITHLFNGDIVRGARKLHYRDSPVLDLGNPYNAIQLLRRSFLVDYAEDDDLNVVGRNLGVYRYPYLPQNDTYREIVKALAYNPRGTMRGIKLALDAMVGVGNYELYEDLIRHPCTLYLLLKAAILLEKRSIGHAYAQGPESQLATLVPDEIPLSAFPCSRGSLENAHWRDMCFLHSFAGSVRPSAVLTEDYEGDPGTALWVFDGSNELAQVVPGTDYVTLVDAALGFGTLGYQVNTRANYPGMDQGFKASVLFNIPSGFCQNDDVRQWGVRICDGWSTCTWGVRYFGGQYLLSLYPFSDEVAILPDTWYEVTIEKRVASRGAFYVGIYDYWDHEVVLTLNGRETFRSSYRNFAGGGTPHICVGCEGFSTPLTNTKVYVKHVGVETEDRTELLDGLFFSGTVGDTGPNRLSGADPNTFRSEDLGKRLFLRWLFTINPYGGTNKGTFLIHSRISDTEVELRGEVQTGASMASGTPTRIIAATPVFRSPDDLGRKIVVTGSTLGNDGTYTINKLVQMGSGTDFADFDTPIPEMTNLCEVEEAVSFLTETGLSFYLLPNFVSEGAMFTLGSAAEVTSSGGLPVVALHGVINAGTPINNSVDVAFSQVLTGQVLQDSTPVVAKTSDDPLEYSWYPFYLTDPLGFVRAYLEDLLAAGVIPEYQIEEIP